jgi:hypothetical protein
MGEHRRGQVHSYVWYCLTLWLVDRHGEAEPNWELLSLELKWEHLIIRGAQGYPRKENPLPGMLP